MDCEISRLGRRESVGEENETFLIRVWKPSSFKILNEISKVKAELDVGSFLPFAQRVGGR